MNSNFEANRDRAQSKCYDSKLIELEWRIQQIAKKRQKIQNWKYIQKEILKFWKSDKAIGEKMCSAATFLQKHVRGYLARRKYHEFFLHHSSKSISRNLVSLLDHTQYCRYKFKNNQESGLVLIQKSFRRFIGKIKCEEAYQRHKLYRKKTIKKIIPMLKSYLRTFVCKERTQQLRRIQLKNKKIETLQNLCKRLVFRKYWNKYRVYLKRFRRRNGLKKTLWLQRIFDMLPKYCLERGSDTCFDSSVCESVLENKKLAYGIKVNKVKRYVPIPTKSSQNIDHHYSVNNPLINRQEKKKLPANLTWNFRDKHYLLPTVAHKNKIDIYSSREQAVPRKQSPRTKRRVLKSSLQNYRSQMNNEMSMSKSWETSKDLTAWY